MPSCMHVCVYKYICFSNIAAQPTPTLSLQQEPQTLEEVMETLTTTAATSAGSKNLPAIVGGTLVGVAILVTICVIFLCRWCRSKTENSAKYCKLFLKMFL